MQVAHLAAEKWHLCSVSWTPGIGQAEDRLGLQKRARCSSVGPT